MLSTLEGFGLPTGRLTTCNKYIWQRLNLLVPGYQIDFFSHVLETCCKPIKGLLKAALLGSDLLCRRNDFKWFLT